ncbi:MAG: hypothetical protein LCH77_02790 [Actinobacteria bacterium]|nr:hypothetical protein [Actinomycetota bacterium]
MSAPAGWYSLPDGTQRYWDGAQWAAPSAPAAPSAWPQDQVAGGSAYPQQPYAAPQPYSAPPQPYAAPSVYGSPQPYGQPGQPSYAVGQIAPKNPGLSLLASFFIPGLGTMINGEVGKGVAMLVIYLVSWPLILVLIGIPMMLVVWIWGMVDAYTGAQNWNRRHGIWS